MRQIQRSASKCIYSFQNRVLNVCMLILLLAINPVHADNANSSAYNFNFDEFLTWTGHIEAQPSDHGIYIQEFAPDEWGLVFRSKSRANRTIIYDDNITLNNVYQLTFRARIDSYAVGDDISYPLRVTVKNGTHALVLYFREDGIFHESTTGVTKITDAVVEGVWNNYHLEFTEGEARLLINDGSPLVIDDIVQSSASTSIQLSSRGDRFATSQATLDTLRLAPERTLLNENWSDLADWNAEGTGYIFNKISAGTTSYLNVVPGGNERVYSNNTITDIAAKYTVELGLKVTDFGQGDDVVTAGVFSGTHLADVRLDSNGYVMIRDNSNIYVQTSSQRQVILDETIRLKLQVSGSEAKLWEIGSSSNSLLHSWQLPLNAGDAKIRFYAGEISSVGGSFDLLYLNYSDDVLVDHAPPFSVGKRINFANGESFGVSHNGGGYGSNLKLTPSGKNILGAGFGAGFVSALRSNMHNSGDYNPTQAGTADHMGVPTRLTKSINIHGGDVITIEPVATPLFMLETLTYDWQQNEPIRSSDGTTFGDRVGQDAGNSDDDGLYETHLKPEDELRSEVNFTGLWEDVSAMATTGNSILRHYARWDYKRNPDAILQFNAKSNGIDENWRVDDLSPQLEAGDQTPTDIDISYLLNTYSIRLLDNQGYKYFMWKEEGVWQAVLAENNIFYHVGVVGTDSTTDPAMNSDALGSAPVKQANLGVNADVNLMIISKTANPNAVGAVGLYFPWDSNINLSEVSGYARDESSSAPLYSENRNINSYFSVSLRTNKWMTIFLRMWHLGLRAPDHGNPNIYESLQNEYYHIMGTPNEIFATATELEQAQQ
jgi:hypothetical protein